MVRLFQKGSKKTDTGRKARSEDLDEDAVSAEGEETADETADGVGPESDIHGVKEISTILARLDELEDKLARLDSGQATARNEMTQSLGKLNQLEQDIRKLLSIYEVVSAKFNPFIEVPSGQARSPERPLTQGPEFGEVDLESELPEFHPYREGEREPTPQAKPAQAEATRGVSPWEPATSTMMADREPAPDRLRQKGPAARPPSTSEQLVMAQVKSKHNKKPLLAYIPHDYLTLVLVMRWIEFLFERVTREKLSLVLDYYVDVGWISEDVKSEIMSYARGEMQDVTKCLASEEAREDALRELAPSPIGTYKKVEDWRLSAEDHLKSLLFIQKIAGLEIDKDKLNSLEQHIAKFKESLEGFHGV